MVGRGMQANIAQARSSDRDCSSYYFVQFYKTTNIEKHDRSMELLGKP